MRLAMPWLVAAAWSCVNLDEQQPHADAKFVAYVQALVDGVRVNSETHSLLHKVGNDSLTIGYGFAPACNGKYTDAQGERDIKYTDAQVERDITAAMRQWLQPLRDWPERPGDATAIVETFTYLKGTASAQNTTRSGLRYRDLSGTEGSDLEIVFYCERGRSSIFFKRSPPHINMWDKSGGKYSLATLTHEVGHAFGLTDTYVEYGSSRSGRLFEADTSLRYNQSDCGSQRMIGCQPLSVMNVHTWLIDDSAIALGKDDIAGLRWLYRYIVTGDEACPLGFISELSTGGCVPKDPLSFAMQQGDIDNTIALLSERGLPIDAQDDKGNTVLHYAAQRAASHGADFYRKGIEAGASPDIANQAGMTPRDILLPAIETAMQDEDLYNAEALIAIAIAD